MFRRVAPAIAALFAVTITTFFSSNVLVAQSGFAKFEATEIVVPGADTVTGQLMNDQGDVVVSACSQPSGSAPVCESWLWQKGTLSFLADGSWSMRSISPNGIVVGVEQAIQQRAAIFFGGTHLVLPGVTGVTDLHVNSLGHVAGTALQRAFLWRNGQLIRPTGAQILRSRATSINDWGQVVGILDHTPFVTMGTQAFVWWNGVRYNLLPADDVSPALVNGLGHVVQPLPRQPGSDPLAAVFRGGQFFVVGGLDPQSGFPTIMDLNNRGDVATASGAYLSSVSGYENRPLPTVSCRFFPGFECKPFVASLNDARVGVARVIAHHVPTGFDFPDSSFLWDTSTGALAYLEDLAPGVCSAFPVITSQCVEAQLNNQGWILVSPGSSRAFVLKPVSGT